MYYCDECQIIFENSIHSPLNIERWSWCPIHKKYLYRLLINEFRHKQEIEHLISFVYIEGNRFNAIELKHIKASDLLLIKEVYEI